MPQDGLVKINRTDESEAIGYSPGVPGDWSVQPKNVRDALDNIRSEFSNVDGIVAALVFYGGDYEGTA
jgi:hypothetical protein